MNDDVLQKSFQKFTTLVKAKVVRDKRTNKTKGLSRQPLTSACKTSGRLQTCLAWEDCCQQGSCRP